MTAPASPRWSTAGSSAAAPRASSQLAERLETRALGGASRHRPHPLGHPRRAHRDQRPPARRRRRGPGPQRHHRELRRAEGRAGRQAAMSSRARPTPRSSPIWSAPWLEAGLRPRAGRRWRRSAGCTGAYALAVLIEGEDELMLGARAAARWSSAMARARCSGLRRPGAGPFTSRIPYLDEGDIAVLDRDRRAVVRRASGGRSSAPVRQTALAGALIEKGNYRHFMEKEIHEQPAVLGTPCGRSPIRRPTDRRCRTPFDFAASRASDRRLRHRLLRRPDRQILVRAAGRPAGRRRDRLGVPLPRAGAGAGDAGHRRLPVGRDRRHPGGAALWCRPQGHDRRRRQRAREHHGARGRRAVAHPCRARDRRRLDQGLHRPGRRC